MIDNYFRVTYKSTKDIIDENSKFFRNIKEVIEVCILGHSLSSVDIKYFEKIIQSIDVKDSKWLLSFYDEKDKEHHKQTLLDLGLKEDQIEMVTMVEFSDYFESQLSLF